MFNVRVTSPNMDTSVAISCAEDIELLDAIVTKIRAAFRKPVGGLDCGVDLRTGKGVCVCGRCSTSQEGESR
jgi:hypothetical protein